MLNLKEIFDKLEDYVVIKFDQDLPKYKINDDVDILTSNIHKNKNIIVEWYNDDIFFHKLININLHHIQLDMYLKNQPSRLHFRFDLFEKLHYDKFSLNDEIYSHILKNKIHNSVCYVPCLADDLSFRYCEYIEYIDIRKDKIKHLNYTNKFDTIFYKITKGEKECKLNYQNTSCMYNSIIVWGHGMKDIIDILNFINTTIDCNILNVKKGVITDFEYFIKNIYKLEMVNINHIISKTNYLKTVKNEYIHILLKNNGANIKQYGEGQFKVFADENIVNLKWKLREKYNPRFTNSNLQPSKNLPPGISHNHIIHATDSNEECNVVCNFILNNNPRNYENKIVNGITLPWHLNTPNTISKIRINIDKLHIGLAIDSKSYNITDSPHYKYVCDDKESYKNYYSKYLGTKLQDNHTPEQFDKLISNFNPNTYKHEVNRLIIINRQCRVLDGVHRLSILKKNNITEINVIVL